MGVLIGPGLKFQCSKLSTCAASDLPDLPTSKITSGTFDAARIPDLSTAGYGSALLVDGSRAMEGTLQLGSHELAGVGKHMFSDYDVALKSESLRALSLISHDESLWCNFHVGWLGAYGGIAAHGTVDVGTHPVIHVPTPVNSQDAANKSYVDDHNWDAGDITSGTLTTARIPVLPTSKYGSALLVDGSRAMEGTLQLGSHELAGVGKHMFSDYDVSLKSESLRALSLISHDESLWCNLHVGWLGAYGGIAAHGTVDVGTHPVIHVPTPVNSQDAANKSYVDDHNWDAGDITSGTLTTARIPVLPTSKYGSALLVDGSRGMEGKLQLCGQQITGVRKHMFSDYDVSLKPESLRALSLISEDESVWCNFYVGWLSAYSGIAAHGTVDVGTHPVIHVPTPVNSQDAANKSYVDDHNWDAGDITSGTLTTARIPVLPTSKYGSALLVDGSRAMAGTLQLGSHELAGVGKHMFSDYDVSLKSESLRALSLISHDESLWCNLHVGWLSAYGGIAAHGTVDVGTHPVVHVPTPVNSQDAANKSYVDDHNWDAGDITSGTLTTARIPVLPTSKYGSALLVDGSRAMAGTLQLGSHELAGVGKHMFSDYDVSLKSESLRALSLISHDESLWCNLKAGWIDAYGGIAAHGTVDVGAHPVVHVPTPEYSQDAANKSYVDDHNWDAGDITSGTLTTARIPVLPTSKYGSALLVDGSRAMEGTLQLGSHELAGVGKHMFSDYDVSLKSESLRALSLISHDESLWCNLHVGWLGAYGGIAAHGTVDVGTHPVIHVPTPVNSQDAANKSYVDDHNWDAGDITSGTLTTARIPVLPTSKYGSALLVDGSRGMEGKLQLCGQQITGVRKHMFSDYDVSLKPESLRALSLISEDESVWCNFYVGWLSAYSGIAAHGTVDVGTHPVIHVPTPVNSQDAANKSYVDDHNWDAGDITSGTLTTARIPVLPTSKYGSALLVDGSRAMAGTLQLGSHELAGVGKHMFSDYDVSLKSESLRALSLISHDESLWCNLHVGWLSAYGGIAAHGTVDVGTHPVVHVPTPVNSQDAANKSYVDDHNWDAGDITSGTLTTARIPVLPTSKYGSALLVDGSRAMAGTLQLGSHELAGVGKHMFSDYDVSLKSESLRALSLISHDESLWCNLKAGWIDAYGGIAAHGTVDVGAHPVVHVPTPEYSQDAANKSYVDDHNWDAGDITSGVLNTARIPVLPTSKYASALLVDGSRSMENTLSLGSHPVDEASKYMFRAAHDVAIVSDGVGLLSVTSRNEASWANLGVGGLAAYTSLRLEINTINASASITTYQLLVAYDGWYPADADYNWKSVGMLGIALESKSGGQAIRVALFGTIVNPSWSWSTAGVPLYISCTPGTLTDTPPSSSGRFVRKVGFTINATTIFFNPDATTIELA